jgi:hypothetical protein
VGVPYRERTKGRREPNVTDALSRRHHRSRLAAPDDISADEFERRFGMRLAVGLPLSGAVGVTEPAVREVSHRQVQRLL